MVVVMMMMINITATEAVDRELVYIECACTGARARCVDRIVAIADCCGGMLCFAPSFSSASPENDGSGAAGDRETIDFQLQTFRKLSILYPSSLGTVSGRFWGLRGEQNSV